MRSGSQLRGWPLLSLGILLGSWVLVRTAIWEAPFERIAPLTMVNLPISSVPADNKSVQPPLAEHAPPAVVVTSPEPPSASDWREEQRPASVVRPDFERRYDLDSGPRNVVARGGMRHARLLMAHTALLSSGYKQGSQPQPISPSPYPANEGPVSAPITFAPAVAERFVAETDQNRWGMDMWALWRNDTTTAFTSGRPSYGRSQAGAVVRYRLAPSSGHAPQAYVRATRALEGESQADVAAGLSARPIPSVPVLLAAEARVSETDGGTELRSAVFAVTELPRVTLPAGFEGEAYLQGGYVSGANATPFADGQARITRRIIAVDDFRLSAGGGAWGGAQDDAQRLDIGPTAGVSFDVGEARGCLSADYRFRVAGDAEPSSGPALTLTAGF